MHAFELYHRYLKNNIQTESSTRSPPSLNYTLRFLEIIHQRQFRDEIEKASVGPEIIRTTPSYLQALPALEFPFDKAPSIWNIEKTVLLLSHGKRLPIFVWCYLERHVIGACNFCTPASFSAARAAALPLVIQRLSEHFKISAASSKTVYDVVSSFGRFLIWLDNDEHAGRFETVLSDSGLAIHAIELYHRYLKTKIQTHASARRTVVNQEINTMRVLDVIHQRQFSDEIEKIRSDHRGGSTKALKDEDIAQFMSSLAGIFDSALRILDSGTDKESDGTWQLSLPSSNDIQTLYLEAGYSRARLMDLAAMSYAGLVLGDSGTNLAQLQRYEEPADLSKQLAAPERINLTKKVIKLRAGGRLVPVTMTAVTFTRLRHFAKIRHQIIELLGCDDIAPFFFKCEYIAVKGRTPETRFRIGSMEPLTIQPISDYFLVELRKKTAAAGVRLPHVTTRQLRSNRQQYFVKNYGLPISAEVMGHSIATAVRAYCAAQEGTQANDIGRFMASLQKTVIQSNASQSIAKVSVPVGECISHGNPVPSDPTPTVNPDCKKTEGCFFCENFRVHADQEDLRKLQSCRSVLQKIDHLQGESARADRVYQSVFDRIEFLLCELRQILGTQLYETTEAEVSAGNLTHYWAVKSQQLRLLGLIAAAT
ncbi:hypothetical protein H8K38_02390 [Undibacterium sp. FT79W]|uniref:hypothetical protein n=1 Tax=Undibacterium sp. FT79W TaxID=2762296 RepID=UPI00164BD472|nr:hypothetical protein [Undibacterium sp. FT79W]MBC3876650.1 hypothetical protein [Undibacterium sp. FT79W]